MGEVPLYPSARRGVGYRGTLLMIKPPPPQEPSGTLGIGVQQGPSGGCLPASKVPVYRQHKVAMVVSNPGMFTYDTVDCDPFITSQLASRN